MAPADLAIDVRLCVVAYTAGVRQFLMFHTQRCFTRESRVHVHYYQLPASYLDRNCTMTGRHARIGQKPR